MNNQSSIWDKLSEKYDKLWVQKYSLTPTRNKVCTILGSLISDNNFRLLDLGCGTGQLIETLSGKYKDAIFYGTDKSQEMINIAKSKNITANFSVSTAENLNFDNNTFDFVTCCHSFPYYENKNLVVQNIKNILKGNGYAIFIQASVNNFYDKIIMWGVEKTAETAQYLSKEDFKKYFMNDFDILEEFDIREKFFMPTISGFILRVKK